jgi:outer membrane usher protein
VQQADSNAQWINASKYLNPFLLQLSLLALTPSGVLAEDTSLAVKEVFAEVLINQNSQDIVVLLRLGDRLFAGSKDLRSWRLRLPDTKALNHYGEDFYAFDALEGLSYRFDESTQALMVEAPPSLFDATQLEGAVINFSDLPPASTGGFFNYDVFSNHAQDQITTSGLLELGGFGSWGASQTNILFPELDGQTSAIRLDTTWVRDQPMQMASLRFGDIISGTGSWEDTVHYGGVQWATNFSTQPDFIPFPLPEMSGKVALPSTVDLYVGNELRMSHKVPSGPFNIQDLPVKPGQGDARLVVRDILGREEVLIQPFYVTPLLLNQGLHDYSYELGFVRRNFGIDSNNYGRLVAVGTHRLGFTEKFTGEVHSKLLSNQQSVGLGGVLLSPVFGVLSGSLAMSHSQKGVGGLLELAIQRQSGNLSFAANTLLTSQRFTKLGMLPEEQASRQISNMFINLMAADYGSFGVFYGLNAYRDRKVKKELFASYARDLGKFGKLNVFVNRDKKMALNLNFSVPFGNQSTANLNTSAERGKKQALLRVNSRKLSSSGIGYRLSAGMDDTDPREAEVSLQNKIGNYTLVANQSQDQTTFRGSASGGVAFLGGSAFLTPRINGSFAVVQVPDYPGVGVYANNNLLGRTDAKGNALVTRLHPYQKNSVRIDQVDLPFDAQINVAQIDAVPYFRSGLLLKFPVKRFRGALLTVVLENGEPLPAGAQVQIIGDKTQENEVFPTGMRGEVYLTGLAASNRLKVTWQMQSCEFELPFPVSTEPLPHLGTYICNKVEP